MKIHVANVCECMSMCFCFFDLLSLVTSHGIYTGPWKIKEWFGSASHPRSLELDQGRSGEDRAEHGLV